MADGIAEADRQHGLAGVLQDVDNLLGRGFQVEIRPVSKKVIIGGTGHGLRQAFAELLLQEANHFTDTLQGESAVAQLTNHGDFGEIFHGVEATVPFPRRYHDAALIPPLQLAWGDPG